ncbi:hypothetical protein W97_07798 [Coniosporium apollinis CBS 100218]|uniref:PepSY domain-containing protein n=1 Tax=Coniosporium apollinis (strain CBS 100218) TaxID=1168221 RepID=R7Z2Y1_CONA1|nr:uncharacterized protein W97_07798 [Coniosporium apollinis CBS 100218]EON68540.1 hypothetical protein W97_07798 [Coniosporium apollinis CBS 100218]
MFAFLPVVLALFSGITAFAAPAASFNPNELSKRLAEGAEVGIEVVPTLTDDKLRELAFWENGVLQGYMIEKPDDGNADTLDFYFTDAKGNVIDVDAEADDNALEKRALSWITIGIKLASIIRRWGPRVWTYFYCVGIGAVSRCADTFLRCATMGQAPWTCPAGLLCVGSVANKCR